MIPLKSVRVRSGMVLVQVIAGGRIRWSAIPAGKESKVERQSAATHSSNLKTGNQRFITLKIGATQISEEPTPASDHFQQAVAGVVILLIDLEVFRQLTDALRQQRHLNVWRTGVRFMEPVVCNRRGPVGLHRRHMCCCVLCLGGKQNPYGAPASFIFLFVI